MCATICFENAFRRHRPCSCHSASTLPFFSLLLLFYDFGVPICVLCIFAIQLLLFCSFLFGFVWIYDIIIFYVNFFLVCLVQKEIMLVHYSNWQHGIWNDRWIFLLHYYIRWVFSLARFILFRSHSEMNELSRSWPFSW